MPRLISIADSRKRDAAIELHSPRPKPAGRYLERATREAVHVERLIKSTDRTSYEALLQQIGTGNDLASALIVGDPEIDLDVCGRRLGYATRVYVDSAGAVLYAARTLLVTTRPDGNEVSRDDFVDVESTVGETLAPLRWTGKLHAKADIVRKYVLGRKLQLRHINGLTFDFLFEMARVLHEENELLHVRPGNAGEQHLIFQTNGTRFNGFLEGRVQGESYLLVLHLTNLELKRATASAESESA